MCVVTITCYPEEKMFSLTSKRLTTLIYHLAVDKKVIKKFAAALFAIFDFWSLRLFAAADAIVIL